MLLVNQGDPKLLRAMGVDGRVLGTAPGVYGDELAAAVTADTLAPFVIQAEEARDLGLACRWIYPDWRLIEKAIQSPGSLDTALRLFDRLAELGLTDVLTSCGLQAIDRLAAGDRAEYEKRFIAVTERLYDHAAELGLHLCLHASLMPWIYLSGPEAWDRWFDRLPIPSNCMILCLGCVASAGLDPVELIARWGDRIRAIHVRNVVGRFCDRSHRDVRVDCGTLDLPRLFAEFARVGFQGAVMPEHFPEFPGDSQQTVSQAFALGYARALIQAFRPSGGPWGLIPVESA